MKVSGFIKGFTCQRVFSNPKKLGYWKGINNYGVYGIPSMIDFQSIGLDIEGVSKHWKEVYMVIIQKSQGLKVYNWIRFPK